MTLGNKLKGKRLGDLSVEVLLHIRSFSIFIYVHTMRKVFHGKTESFLGRL